MAQLEYNDYLQQLNYFFDDSEQIVNKKIQKLNFNVASLDNKVLLAKKDVYANNNIIEELQHIRAENVNQIDFFVDIEKESLQNILILKQHQNNLIRLKTQLIGICKEHNRFKNRISNLKGQIQKLDFELDDLDDKIIRIKKDISVNNFAIAENKTTLTQFSNQINDLVEVEKKSLNNLSAFRNKRNGLIEQKNQLEDVFAEYSKTETLIKNLKNKNEISIRDIPTGLSQIEELKTNIEFLETELSEYRNVERISTESSNQLKQVQNELTQLQNRNKRLVNSVKQRKQDIKDRIAEDKRRQEALRKKTLEIRNSQIRLIKKLAAENLKNGQYLVVINSIEKIENIKHEKIKTILLRLKNELKEIEDDEYVPVALNILFVLWTGGLIFLAYYIIDVIRKRNKKNKAFDEIVGFF